MKYMNTIRENIKGMEKIDIVLLIYSSLIMCKCLGCFLNSKINRSGQHVVKLMLNQ